MRQNVLFSLVSATLVATVGLTEARADWMQKMQGWWNQGVEKAQETYTESWDVLPGEITLCVATELKDWINKAVVPSFKQKAPRISVKIEAHGSGELADAMNAGNTMKCDLFIAGSDVSALRWKGFDITKRKSIAYSAVVWVGDKEKLDAARAFLGKPAASPLGCGELAKVAGEGRYSKLKQDGKGKVDLEMTTSNSGQSMYVSCVYSMVDALDPDEVEQKLNAKPELEDEVRAFFKQVKFDVDSTTTLTMKPEGDFLHPNGIGYKHLAIATYESFLPELDKRFTAEGKTMEALYPPVSILSNFPAVAVTTEGKNGKAAAALMSFLLGTEAQSQLPRYGFRPSNPKVDYSADPVAKYFKTNIEVGDAPSSQRLLREMWDIVSGEAKAQAVKF